MKTLTQQEFFTEAESRFGADVRNWKFVCPMCGTVQSVQQLHDAVVASGETEDRVDGYIGFSCIGRFTGQRNEGITAKNRGEKWDKGCNWTLGGLFKFHTLEIVTPDGALRPIFELAAS